tara:strand:+ start:2550 stop:2714 length:165 start_codon:yes stop_codon:yes gene_type:complete
MNKYTMKDVNKLMADRGWRQNQAMSYYIEIGAKTGSGVSKSLENNYNRAMKKYK